METEATFIDDIRKHPRDHAQRIAFADWLQSRQQDLKSQYLRLQVEQALLLNRDPRFRELAKNLSSLYREIGRGWCSSVATPQFPLIDQILVWSLNLMDPPLDVFAIVLKETKHYVELTSIKGRDFPKLPPVKEKAIGRFKKVWHEGGVRVGEHWHLWCYRNSASSSRF